MISIDKFLQLESTDDGITRRGPLAVFVKGNEWLRHFRLIPAVDFNKETITVHKPTRRDRNKQDYDGAVTDGITQNQAICVVPG